MHFYVYEYLNPETGLPFYIGKGKNGRDRSHLVVAKNNASRGNLCSKFCRKLLDIGIIPIINRVKDGLSELDACHLEQALIEKYGRLGFEPNGLLVNRSKGGKSNSGWKHTSETKSYLADLKRGTKSSEETKKLISLRTSEALQDPIARKKISDTHLGKPKSEMHRQHMKDAQAARSPEIKAKLAAKALKTRIDNGNLYHSPETKAKISSTVKTTMSKPEVVNRMKESSKKRWSNPEERAKIAAKNAKTFHLTNRETGESFTISNLAKYCRENKTYEQKVYKEFTVIRLDQQSSD